MDIIAAAAAQPVVSFAEDGPSTVPHGGNEVRIRVNLSSPVPAGETLDVQWSWLLAFDAGAPVCPTTISNDLTTLICSTTVDGNAVLPASADSFEIVFNSAGSDADDIGDSQAINLVDAVGYTRGTPNSHEVEIIAQPVVGFTAGTADGVFWGQDNLTFSVSFAPPLSANPDVALPFDFLADGFNINWVSEVDAGNVLACAGTSCDLTNPDETQSPIVATVQFTQNAADTPARTVTVSLSDIYLVAINAAIDGDHDYIFGNQSLEVDVINPTVSRTPNLPIDIREGESANVVFTRFPIIGNGDNFAVGVGFANGASAADIATITVNGNACDLAATEISCTGNFGSGVGDLTVAISIAADADPAELAEQISLTLTVQNDHDINPAAGLFAVVNIINVPNADFAAADSELAHSDGTTGGQTEVQLDLAGTRPSADYRVAWSFTAPPNHPFRFNCTPVGGGAATPIDGSIVGPRTCESVVPDGSDSVNIVINSANDSTADDISEVANIDDRLVLRIVDGDAYNPGETAVHRVAIISPPIIRVLGASASSSQVKGYLATIAFELTAPAAADTTGTLTVTFADGILGDEVVGVSGAGDFICTETDGQPTDSCVHIFESEDATKESLSLVLSLAIGGDSDTVPMAFSGTASGYVVTESDINLTRTNYTVTFAAADQIPNLTEGAAADAFDLSVTPALANDITIALRLTAAATPADALDPADVTLLRLPNTPITCTPDTSDAARQILDCTLIALGVSGLDVAAAPTGTSAHGFSIGAVNDIDVDGIDVQARPIAGVGYDIPATDSDPSTNTDDFTIQDPVGDGSPIANFESPSSNVRAEGGRIVIGVGLGAVVPEATTEGIEVVWTYDAGEDPHSFIPACFDASRVAVQLAQSATTCQTNVPAGQSSFEITVVSTDDSVAGVGTLTLSIAVGTGYDVGTTPPNHLVNIIAPPGLSYSGTPPLSPRGAFVLRSNGGQLRAGLLLSETVPAGESQAVRWTYTHATGGNNLAGAGFVIPAGIRCFTVDGDGVETVIPNTGATTFGTCESVVSGGANSVEITLNSAVGSSGGGAMSLRLIDGIGYAPPENGFRFVNVEDFNIAAVERDISQFNGYYAAIAFNLADAIDAATAGTLTVSFADGILGDAVSAVAGAGDFICDAANDQCVYDFNADDVGDADDVGETSLSLVLSVSIGDPPPLQLSPSQVTMVLSGSALGYNVDGGEDLAITLSRANYLVDLAAGAMPDLIEGSEPSVFTVDITPRPVVGLTVTLRFRDGSALVADIGKASVLIIDQDDIAISRRVPADSDDFSDAVTCLNGVAADGNPVLSCTLIVPPDSSATSAAARAATPSGTYEPQFSIAALADDFAERNTEIQAIFRPRTPNPGPGGYVAGPNLDRFVINPDGGPDVRFVNTPDAVSEVQAAGGGVEIPLALSESSGTIIDILWSYTIAGVAADDPGTPDEDEAEPIPFAFVCSDDSGVPQTIALSGECEFRVLAGHDAFTITVATPEDSDLSDYAGSPVLNFQIDPDEVDPDDPDDSTAYDIVATNDRHRVNLVAAAAAAGEVAYAITDRTTPNAEALIGEYWNRVVALPFNIAPPLADADNDAAIAFIPSSEIDAAFSPLNPAGTAAAANCNSTACSLVVDDYGTDPIADFSIPITLSQADAGRLITLTASLADFEDLESGAYTFAAPASVVISIRYPRLDLRQNGGNSAGASEGEVMNFEIVPLDENGGTSILPGIMTATISITFANSATSADYELQDATPAAIVAEASTPAFDLYEIVINPADAASRLFQVSVATDAIAERRLSNANAEAIAIRLAQPSDLAAGYQATLAAVTGLSRILGNAPAAANFVEADSDVQAGGGIVLIDLNLSEAVAATAEPVTISWSFADGASFGTDATCFDSTDGSSILAADIDDAIEGNCRSVVSAGSDTAQILITANADSVADDANLINLDLGIIAGDGSYNIGTAQRTHIVDIIAAEAAGEVSFSIADRTTPEDEAAFSGYWGAINGQQSFLLPLQISPPYPASGTPPILDVTSVTPDGTRRNFPFSFTVPDDLDAFGSTCVRGESTCARPIREYVDDANEDIAAFDLPFYISSSTNAGRLFTLTIAIGDFEDAPGGAYAVADPASVVITILAPNLSVGRVESAESSNEGDIVRFQIIPFEELNPNTTLTAFPGIMDATVSITFADGASSADYELQNNINAAVTRLAESNSSFDLYRIRITRSSARSIFQVSVVADTIPEPQLSSDNAESITVHLLSPAAVSDVGYRVTEAARVGLPLILGNAPAAANFVEENSDVQEGGSGRVLIDLNLSEAVAANAEPVTITWTFNDGGQAFDPVCVRNGTPQPSTGSTGTCESVVAPGRQQTTITVNSTAGSDADDGEADLVLNIIAGNGYTVGTTQRTHEVALFNTPDASFAATENSNLEHGDGTTGEQVEVRLNLEGTRPSADYRIRWSFAAPANHPFRFACGGGVADIDGDDTSGNCESVVPSGLDFVNIVINSAGDSTAADINSALVLRIEDGDEYNLGATDDHRVVIVSPPIIGVAAESASPSQVKGYLATIAITLTEPAAADTTGDLTVAFATDGVLNDEVSGVVIGGDVVGDFACIERTAPLTDICTHTFAAADDGVESLSLVLSLAIGGDLDDVQMAFSGEASGFAVTESNINLTRTNYVVNFDPADADPIGNLTEGAAAADAFDLSVTPRLANDITIAFRLAAITDTPANALDAGDVVLLRTSDDAAVTCTDATGTEANQILDCTLIALGVSGLDVAAAPTGTSAHGFSIGAVDDSVADGIGVQAGPIAGVGYGISATAPDTNTDDFRIIDSASAGLPELSFAASGTELRSNGDQLRVGLQLSSPVPVGESVVINWGYNHFGTNLGVTGFEPGCFTVAEDGTQTVVAVADTSTGSCQSVVPAGANSVEIIINSAVGSVAEGGTLPFNLELQVGDGYDIPAVENDRLFGVVLINRAIAAAASPQGYNGYHAAVSFNLEQAIEAATTGTLTVSFDSGVLSNEVVAPGAPGVGNENRAGDFTCNTDNNRCEYVFNGVNNVGDTSLSLVLSLAIFGDASLSEADLLVAERVTMTLGGAARGYQVAASPITLSLSRYNPTIPQGEIQGDIVEGDPPLVFGLSITPRPPVALTVSVRFQRGSAEEVIEPADIAIRRVTADPDDVDPLMACNVAGTDVPTFCSFEIPADTPTVSEVATEEVYLPQFSLEVLKDNVFERENEQIQVQVFPVIGPGYRSDDAPGDNGVRLFNLIDGAPDVRFVEARGTSQVLPNGGSVEIPLALSVRPRESLAIRWTYTIAGVRTDLSEVNPFDFVCRDALGNELDIVSTGQCVSTVNGAATPPADTTFSIIINTVDDSQGPDAFVGRPGLNLQINPGDENNAYNIITTNDEHQVSLVDAIAQPDAPDADFAAPSSDVRAEGGRIEIPVNIVPDAPVGGIDVVWTYNAGADPHPFIPVCLDATETAVPLAQSATTCQTNVPAGQSSFEITVSSTNTSAAGDGTLTLSIAVGTGYDVGTTPPNHLVNVIAPPDVSFAESGQSPAEAGQSSVPYGGDEVRIQVALSLPVPADETLGVQWSFDNSFGAGAPVCPNPAIVGTTTTCTTTVNGNAVPPASADSFEIVFNSAGSDAGNIGNRLAINLEDAVGYTLGGRNTHTVEISQPPSDADFVEASSQVADTGGQVLIPVRLANEVHPLAQSVTIQWSYTNGENAFDPVCIRGGRDQGSSGNTGQCESVVAPSQQQATITVNSTTGSNAGDGGVLVLEIDEGSGYNIGATQTHRVNLFDAPDASFNVAASNLGHGDGANIGQAQVRLNLELGTRPSVDYPIEWSFTAPDGHPFRFACAPVDGGAVVNIVGSPGEPSNCLSVVQAGDAFVDIIINSPADGTAADINDANDALVLQIIDGTEYNLDPVATTSHQVNIIPAVLFAEGTSNVRTEGGRVEIPVSLGANAPVGGINVVWTYDAGAASHSFIPTCFDENSIAVPVARNAECRTNVPAGQSSFTITVVSTATSPAGAERLNLEIVEGSGYDVGGTQPSHVVNIAPLAVSFASAGPTYSPHAVSGVVANVQLSVDLSSPVLAGETLPVLWSWDSNFAGGAPACPVINVADPTPITTDAEGISTCTRPVGGGEDDFLISFKSALDSGLANVGTSLTIALVDAAGYTLGETNSHIVVISQPDSDANFVTGTSQVSDSGGQVLIPVSLSVQVHPLAQPVTITWTYSDDVESAFEPVCFIGENPQTTGVDSGRCESVVAPGQQQATITVNSTTASDADDGVLFVNLRIVEGIGYNRGTTRPTHRVNLFAAPNASFAAADSNVEANGARALIPLSLSPGGNAEGGVPITVLWTFTDAASVFDVVCDFEGSRVDNPASGSTCESVIEAGGSSSADITVNSGATAAAAAGVLDLEIIDGNGYDLGATVSHQVNIIAPVVVVLPTADFDQASASSDIRAEDGRVTIALSLLPAVADGAEPVTISWSFANGAAFGTNAECFDSVDGTTPILAADIAAADNANCRSVVLPNSAAVSFTITANANSAATDANLELAIIGGFGYDVVGDPPPRHEVILTPVVAVSFASAGPSYSPYNTGEGAANEISKENIIGESLQVLFSQPIPAGETVNVRWSWSSTSAAGVGAPVCPDEGGNPPVTTDPDTGISTCSRTAGAGEQAFGIIFKSDLNSGVGNVGDRLPINLVDFPGYTLGDTTAHIVEISQPDSAASFGGTESGVRSDGGQISIPVILAIGVLPQAQPVTISWSFIDADPPAFGTTAECFDSGGNPIADTAAATEGFCRSVVSRNSAVTAIPITANAGSSAGNADLILSILPGNGYTVGAISTHPVALFDAPDASFAAADSNLEHGTTGGGEQVIVQLNLGDRPNAEYRIRWSFTAPLNHPFRFNCTPVGGGNATPIDGSIVGPRTCESVFAAGDSSVNIIINSAADSTSANINDALVLQIIDRDEYNLGTTDDHRVAIISPPIIRVAVASASPSQFKGYQVTINFALDAPAAADTTGDLIVAFTEDGILGDEVVGVSGAGDFDCDPATDTCTHTFESGDATAESLSLVLSLAVGGDLVGDNVQMAFSGTASGYAVAESQINLTRTNYNVAFADADPIADLTEGAAADTFGLVVTPALANDITIALRLEADADTPANAFDADDVILLRTSDDANVTCTLDTSGATQILDCNLIALGDAAVDVAATPTGTSSHGFSIGAVDDSVADGIGVQALIRSSIPNGYNAVVPNTDAFQINDPDPVDVGGPIGVSAGTPQQSQVPGYRVTVTVALTRPITSADIGGQLTISVTPFALSNPSNLSDRTFQRIGPTLGADNPGDGETDFRCSAGQNRCTFTIGDAHVGDENLLLVLSVRISGAVDQMLMTLVTDDTGAFTIDADNNLMTVTRANYTVNLVSTIPPSTQSNPLPLEEGENANFTLSVSPRPAVELSVVFRMRRVVDDDDFVDFLDRFRVPPALDLEDFVFTAGSGASSLTCRNINDRPLHECTMVVAAVAGINPALSPSGTALPQFNLLVVEDATNAESNDSLANFFLVPAGGIGWERITNPTAIFVDIDGDQSF